MTPRQRAGVGAIILSFVLWGLIFALPFLDLPTKRVAAIGVALYISSYLVFFVGLRLLGRTLWEKLKQRWWPRHNREAAQESEQSLDGALAPDPEPIETSLR